MVRNIKPETDSSQKASSSVIEEIEAQILDVMEKRKRAVEQELEERIKREQEEARKRLDQLESELKGNQESLVDYKNILSQLEADKAGIKVEIKERFERATQLQTEIEEKAGLSLEELRAVNELIKDLGEIKQLASDKVDSLRSVLEKKYGIQAKNLDLNGHDDINFDLESTLDRLQRVKDLLSMSAADQPRAGK